MTSDSQVPEFLWMSQQGAADEADEANRWSGILRVDMWVTEALTRGRPVEHWDSMTRFTPSKRGPIEDMPWSTGAPVVSDRLKNLLEIHAPGQVQYLPIRILYSNQPLDVGQPYWVANYLVVVDCIDLQASEYQLLAGPKGGTRYAFVRSVINKEKVPHWVLVFRPEGDENMVVIRRHLRDVLDASRITGPQYSPLHHV